jgi:hypothetical protein
VIALCGTWRYQQQRSVPQIHQQLLSRRVCISQRNVSHLLERYDELLVRGWSDKQRLPNLVRGQKQVRLAIDGMQPEVGHEVLWVLRDCLSQEILLTRTLLSATHQDLAALLTEVKQAIGVPIA